MPRTQDIPLITKPEENKSFQIYEEVSAIRELIETGGVKLKKEKNGEIKTTKVRDDKIIEKKITEPLQKSNKDQQGFLKGLTETFKETAESLLGSIKKIGTGIAEASFNMMLGPFQLITKPIEEMMGGKIFDKLLGVLKPKLFRGRPTKQKVLPKDPGAVLIAETLEKEAKEKKKAIKGKWLAIAALAGGIIWAAVEGIMGWIKAEDWEVSKLAGAIGGFLGGTGKGPLNAIKNAFKLGAIGAGIGFMVGGGIPGAIIGGLIGLVIGAILGWIGGEKIANFIDGATAWAENHIEETVGAGIGAVVGGMVGLFLGGPIGMLAGAILGAAVGFAVGALTGWIRRGVEKKTEERYPEQVEKQFDELLKAEEARWEAHFMGTTEVKKLIDEGKEKEAIALAKYKAEIKVASQPQKLEALRREAIQDIREKYREEIIKEREKETFGFFGRGVEKRFGEEYVGASIMDIISAGGGMQKGAALIRKPMLTIAGEAGPEAIIPLSTESALRKTIDQLRITEVAMIDKLEEEINKIDENAINKDISMNIKKNDELRKTIQEESYNNQEIQNLILSQLKTLTDVEKKKEEKNIIVTNVNNDIHTGEDIDRNLKQGRLAFAT